MVANDADEAKLNVSYGGGATLPRNQSSTLLKIKSVPIVEIAPIERRYILGVSACKLFYQRFRRSDQPAKCIVLLIHGFGEHVGRFYHVIKELTDAQCDVHTIDLRGHGLSGGPRADGLFADFINDIGQLHRIATAASPRLPVFLYGQSMGGMLAISYALHDTEHRLRGVIATSPWLRLSRIVQPKWWKVLLLKVSWPLFQEFLISSNVDPCSLSSIDGVASAAINDRLCLPFITVRLVFQILSGARQTLKRAAEMKTPILLFHGSADQLTDAEASLQFVEKASSTDKSVRIFEGAFHEIHNDVDRARLFDDVLEWIRPRCETQFPPEFMGTASAPLHCVSSSLDTLDKSINEARRLRRSIFFLFVYIAGVTLSRRKKSFMASVIWPINLLYRILWLRNL